MMFYSGHMRILPIFTTVLCLLLLLLPRLSIGALPESGSGFFKNVVMKEYNWHVDDTNQIIVDSTRILWDDEPGTYPCEEIYKKGTDMGKFVRCELSREVAGDFVMRPYLKIKDLTRDEVISFVEQTGVIGISKYPNSHASFNIKVIAVNVVRSSFLPRSSVSGNGVPPTEVKPPLKCSITNGVINHGSLSGSAVDQHSARTSVSISCNGPATLSVRSEGYSPTKGLMMNGPGTLYSKVNIGGVSAERGVQVSANNSTTVSVTSVLQGKGDVSAGAYSGSVVLVATII